MNNESSKLLLHITILNGKNREAKRLVDSTFYLINNVLDGNQQLPNLAQLYNYCNSIRATKLGTYIRNQCYALQKQESLFFETAPAKTIISNVNPSNKKNIRILLYPGARDSIYDLNMCETTHNMIMQFVTSTQSFFAAEPHPHAPSFYQPCSSVDTALCYLEALIIDSCLCHYLGISDVAFKHDDKQKISREKIDFLLEMAKINHFDFLSSEARALTEYALSQTDISTPYISLFSIFTIAVQDKYNNGDISPYFADYFKLFKRFQKWYFDKHRRLIFKNSISDSLRNDVLSRDKYQGQISPTLFTTKIHESYMKMENRLAPQYQNPPFGVEDRWAIIVIKHTPSGDEELKKHEALFSGRIHPAKMEIIPWSELFRFREIFYNLEIIPIIIDL